MTYVYLHGTLPRVPGASVQDQPLEKCCSELKFLDVLKTSYCESIRQGLDRLSSSRWVTFRSVFPEKEYQAMHHFDILEPIFSAFWMKCTTLACCGTDERTTRLYQSTGPLIPRFSDLVMSENLSEHLVFRNGFRNPSSYQARKTTEDSREMQVLRLEMPEISLQKSLPSFSPISVNKIGRPFRKILRLRTQETPCRCTTLAPIPTQTRGLETRSAHKDCCVIHAVTLA
jgi:hypothetical protein